MPLKEKLMEDLKESMKSKNKVKKILLQWLEQLLNKKRLTKE